MKHIQKLRKLILALCILVGMNLTANAIPPDPGTGAQIPTGTGVQIPTVTISPEGAGTVTISTSGSGSGAMYHFTATPAEGYHFVKWNYPNLWEGGQGSISSNPWQVQVDNFTGGFYGDVTAVFEPTTTTVSGISLDQSAVSLSVGGTQTLTATISPDNATDKSVTWSSDNTSVATVSNGVITAVAVGTANITVTATNGTNDTSDDKQATCTVTVTAEQPVTVAAKADPSTTGAYYATFYDSTTSYVADCEVYYATANAGGRFTLEKAEGNVIKAGEGVILKATGENVTLTKTTTEASYDSLLTGSNTETTVENALVLSLGKNGVWFYKYSGTLGANKAYLAQ